MIKMRPVSRSPFHFHQISSLMTLACQTDSSTVPVIFTVIEPASVLVCACLPCTQGIFKHLPIKRIGSYFSTLSRSSRESRLSGNNQSHPISDTTLKPGQWSKLDERSLSSQAKSEGQIRNTFSDGNEEFELLTDVGTPRKGYGPTGAYDLV